LFLTEQTDPTTAEHLFVTEQMNWRRGLKEFGEKGEDAIEKELQQLQICMDSNPSTGMN